jgi:hypothetical protein
MNVLLTTIIYSNIDVFKYKNISKYICIRIDNSVQREREYYVIS